MIFGDNRSTCAALHDLSANQAQVWQCDLDEAASAATEYTLSVDERARGAQFHFERDRRRFLAGRGVLRLLLARYLHDCPRQLQFSLNAHGKPEVKKNPHALRFNVSHSHNQALFAFCAQLDIGVDIEWTRPDFDGEEILKLAHRFFTTRESRELSSLENAERRAAFFQLWTRKEALLKAIGTGVFGGFSTFEVSLLAGDKAQVLAPEGEAKCWSLFDLPVAAQYSGALAVRIESSTKLDIQNLNFPDDWAG